MNMLNPLFWLSLEAASVEGLLGKILLGLFLLLLVVGVVCRIVLIKTTNDRYIKLIGKRIVALCLGTGFFGVILYFFSYEGIRFFGARFWYPIWLVLFVGWGIKTIFYAMKDVPSMRDRDLKMHAKSKYIPGRKH